MKRRRKYTIVCADCFEWLAGRRPLSIHAVVTDPPFGITEYGAEELKKLEKNGGIWRLPPSFDGHDRKPTPRFTVLIPNGARKIAEFHNKLAPLLLKVLVPGGHVIIASQPLITYIVYSAFANSGFEVRGQIIRTVKTFRGGDRPKGAHRKYKELSVIPRGGYEPWLVFRKPCEGRVSVNLDKWDTGALKRPEPDKPFWDLIISGRTSRKEREIASHPSLKPQAFMRTIVRAVLPKGKGVILDPFAGAGSTLAAAEYFGLRSIGIEINPEFYRTALNAIPKLIAYEPNGSKPR